MAAMEKNKTNLNVPHLRFPEFSGEWENLSLNDIVLEKKKRVSSSTLTTSTYISTENMLQNFAGVSKANGVPSNNVVEYKIGDILISNIRPYLKKIWLANQNGGCSSDIIALSPCENYDGSFVYYLLANDGFVSYVMSGAKGLKMPRGDKQQILKYGISIPSLKEQRKIAALLDLFDQRIETQKKIIEDLKKLKDAINNSLHNNINEFQLFSFNVLGNDYSGLIGKSSEDFGSGLPYISYLNVFRNDIVTDESFDYVKVSKTEKQNVVSYGDLLFTLSSETPSEVGIGAIYLGKTNPIYLNSFCFGVHLSNQENIYGPYLAYFVTSQYFRKTILPFAQGSTRYNLMKSDFMKHKFRFPNMATQKAIYNALHTLSEKIQNEEVCLNKYTEQKQYLLARLFI